MNLRRFPGKETVCSLLFLLGLLNAAHGGGYALRFQNDGNNQFVAIPFAPALNLYPFTVTAWIKAGTQPADGIFGFATSIISKPPVGNDGWSLSIFNGDIRAMYFSGSSANSVSDGGPVSQGGLNGGPVGDDQWHHVAFTVDASGGRIYVDGALRIHGAWTGTPGSTMGVSPIYIGRGPAPAQYVGLLDEITLWNAALSPSQIQTNMNRGLFGLETNLVAYFRCDETVAPISYDAAPAGGTNSGSWSLGVSAVVSDAPVSTPPIVQTLAATGIQPTNALLNALVNPQGSNTFAWFEWGGTTNYGNVTPAIFLVFGTNDFPFGRAVSNLAPETTYYFRAVASNASGTAVGSMQSFSTPPVPLFVLAYTNFPSLFGAIPEWGDYNNDGRLDLIMGGSAGSTHVSGIWLNTGSEFATNASFPFSFQAVLPSATGGDFDNDGRLDVFVTGASPGFSTYNSYVKRNTGSGISATNLYAGHPGIHRATGAWGDFDNDGRLDIVATGDFGVVGYAGVSRNLGGTFLNMNLGFPNLFSGVARPVASWMDYDNDGRLDVFLSGRTTNDVVTQLWRNNGSGFTLVPTDLPGEMSAAAWGDYDNDGRLDLCNGTAIWRNTGSGFSNINVSLPVNTSQGSVAWGDYDNDGRLDLLMGGRTNTAGSSGNYQIWRNTGTGFTNSGVVLPEFAAGLPASVSWVDYDNDGRLDAFLYGLPIYLVNEKRMQLWKNVTPVTNTPPTPPTGLRVTVFGTVATFSWNPSTDAQTPSSGLSYNLRVGTTPGGGEIVSPMSDANGWRLVPRLGNAQMTTSRTITVPAGQTLYWSVQAIDTAFAGSRFAAEQSFTFNSVFTSSTGVPVPGDSDGDGLVGQFELNRVLSNYFQASPWLAMTNVAGLGGTNVTFALTNDLSGALTVEYSTNLVDWHWLGPATPRYLFEDTNSPGEPQRFYRLRWP